MKNITLISLLLFLATLAVCAQEEVVATAASPDNTLRVELLQDGKQPCYRAYKNDKLLVGKSRLGIELSSGRYTQLTFLSQSVTPIDETYSLPSGKVSTYHNRCNRLVAEYSGTLGRKMNITFCLYDEGFAFRYDILGSNTTATLEQEVSEVAIEGFDVAWAQKYHKAYETTYDRTLWDALAARTDGTGTPMLVRNAEGTYMLVTEAANTGVYATSKLETGDAQGLCRFAPVGSVKVSLPFSSPWRVVMAGSLKDIAESVMVENLNAAPDTRDWSWIKPGRASWNWGGEDAENVLSYDIALSYVDLAERMGWEYFLLDAGWPDVFNGWNGEQDARRIIDYARQKGVDVLLWAHHDIFPSDLDGMKAILSTWKEWGAKGVKVDFWEDDAQPMMQKYDLMLQATADLGLLLDLHGCTRPSGLRRTWPQLLTSEAVWGGEMYLGNRVKLAPWHNVMLALTRNVVGPMDYTPGEFATKDGRVAQLTSWAHQLALLTLYESGIQCYTDHPDNYRYHMAESFLRDIPATWDEVRLIEAEPEQYVTMARRKGGEWYVAAICDKARTLHLGLDFLDPDKTYYAYVYADGQCRSDIAFSYNGAVTSATTLDIPLADEGGATVRLSESPSLPKPSLQTYEAEDVRTFGKKTDDASGLCSGGRYVASLGRGNKLPFTVDADRAGRYALTVFYMTDADRNAYLSVNGGEKLYHAFPSTGGSDGSRLALKTVLVDLNAGSNTIELGNDAELAPNIDRITLKSLTDPTTSIGGKPMLSDRPTIRLEDGKVTVLADKHALCSLYTIDGRLVTRWKAAPATAATAAQAAGMYVLNITSGHESYSKKIIIK